MLGDLGLLCDPGHSVDGGRYMNGKRGKRTLRRTHSRGSLSSYSTVVTRPTAYAESIPTRTVYRLCSLYTKYASTSITVIFHISPLSPHFGPRLHLFISARSVEWWMKQRRACFNSSPTGGSWVKTHHSDRAPATWWNGVRYIAHHQPTSERNLAYRTAKANRVGPCGACTCTKICGRRTAAEC